MLYLPLPRRFRSLIQETDLKRNGLIDFYGSLLSRQCRGLPTAAEGRVGFTNPTLCNTADCVSMIASHQVASAKLIDHG
jgi:hypothetical protein